MNEVQKLKTEVAQLSKEHALLEQRVMLLQRLVGMRMEFRKVGEVDASGNFHPTADHPILAR